MKTILVKNDSTRYDDDGDNCKRKETRMGIFEAKKVEELHKMKNQ